MASYNGNFTWSGGSFEVYVISFSYSWKLETRGSSQARRAQTVYPFRATPSDLNVTLQFESQERMVAFAKFARAYHLGVTSKAGEVGKSVPEMFFELTLSSSRFKRYSVALPSVPVRQSYDAVAPTMRLSLKVLADTADGKLNFAKAYAKSVTRGNMTDAISQSNVGAGSVRSGGDAAFDTATTRGQGTTTLGH